MKNVVLVLSAAWAIIITAEYAILEDEMQIQAERYETRLEVQEMEYRDELIEVDMQHPRDAGALRRLAHATSVPRASGGAYPRGSRRPHASPRFQHESTRHHV